MTMTMTILGARTIQLAPQRNLYPGLAVNVAARTALVWRVAVVGFGRHFSDPRARVMEFEAQDRETLRAIVKRDSQNDLAAYRSGD